MVFMEPDLKLAIAMPASSCKGEPGEATHGRR